MKRSQRAIAFIYPLSVTGNKLGTNFWSLKHVCESLEDAVLLPAHLQVSKEGSSPVSSIREVGSFFCTRAEEEFIHITFLPKEKGRKGYRLTWHHSAFIMKIGNRKEGGRSHLLYCNVR